MEGKHLVLQKLNGSKPKMIFKIHLNLLSASVNVVLTKFGYRVRPVTKHKVFMNMDDFW